MAAKIPGGFNAILSGIFTAILAPVAVNILTAEVKPSEGSVGPMCVAQRGPAEVAEVVAEGAGWTPQDAVRDGLRKALAAEIAMLSTAAWAAHGQALIDAVLREDCGLVISCREVSSETLWHQDRLVYHKTLAVAVARQPLLSRLRKLQVLPSP